jgi:hypothetical protein
MHSDLTFAQALRSPAYEKESSPGPISSATANASSGSRLLACMLMMALCTQLMSLHVTIKTSGTHQVIKMESSYILMIGEMRLDAPVLASLCEPLPELLGPVFVIPSHRLQEVPF